MGSRIIAIGDIHGCSAALRALTEAINPQRDDTLIPLGDCIDRGPDSCGVLEQLLVLRDRCRLFPLLGNHEEMMMNYLDGRPQPDDWLVVGGAETLASYGPGADATAIPQEHIEYIRKWGDCFETDTHFFVHASYEPERPLAKQHWQSMRWHTLRGVIPEAHECGKTAVVGHTSLKNGEVLDLGHLVCIDTYCWGGGWLTALDTVSGHIWQAGRDGRLRS
jgi:serine/threonine protein phosphatase 1